MKAPSARATGRDDHAQPHAVLVAAGCLLVGPLCAMSSVYMTFSLGFAVSSQVLAGILGTLLTRHLGPSGRHGANYVQTLAASVSTMASMAVLMQASMWLGVAMPPTLVTFAFLTSVGMLGVGVGMMWTPLLVDRMKLTFPSGLAVAGILRALSDRTLLARSLVRLGVGSVVGALAGWANLSPALAAVVPSPSTVGAGTIVGVRVALPAFVAALVGFALTPTLREMHWLAPDAPFRRVGFLVSLGVLMGAACVDLVALAKTTIRRLRGVRAVGHSRGLMHAMLAWTLGWSAVTAVVGGHWLGIDAVHLAIALALVPVFVLVNGVSTGIANNNPVSSAFVATVFVLAAAGLRSAGVGLLAASIVLIATSVGVDMQQDRSTGRRLGSDRTTQFVYQVIGIGVGSALAVAFAQLFFLRFPALEIDQLAHPCDPRFAEWQSAMTYKMVGALRSIGDRAPYVTRAFLFGAALGAGAQLVRRALARSPRWRWARRARGVRLAVVSLECTLLGSPYAWSFGGFVDLPTAGAFAAGGVVAVAAEIVEARRRAPAAVEAEPEDVRTAALLGGGLVAGESLAVLASAVAGALRSIVR